MQWDKGIIFTTYCPSDMENTNLKIFYPLDFTLLISIAESVNRIYTVYLFKSSRCQIKLCMFTCVFTSICTLYFLGDFVIISYLLLLPLSLNSAFVYFVLIVTFQFTDINIYRLDFEAERICLWRTNTNWSCSAKK